LCRSAEHAFEDRSQCGREFRFRRAAGHLRCRASLRCHGDLTTVIPLYVTIDGRRGRVTAAWVHDRYAGTAMADCIVAVARGFRFPRFPETERTISLPVTN
jgi:hypothetical protein